MIHTSHWTLSKRSPKTSGLSLNAGRASPWIIARIVCITGGFRKWHSAYPQADVYLAPRIREQSAGRIDFSAQQLDRECGYPWDGQITTLPITGNFMTETVFFHHRTRTLVLTDLIENFEPGRTSSRLMRWLTRIGGVRDPDGGMPRDMRLSFRQHKAGLRFAIERMIAWNRTRSGTTPSSIQSSSDGLSPRISSARRSIRLAAGFTRCMPLRR